MNWMDVFIGKTLETVPEGRYRKRAEAELRDHMETQCRALTEAGRAGVPPRSDGHDRFFDLVPGRKSRSLIRNSDDEQPQSFSC